MQVHPYFIIVHQVLNHLIHLFTHPITHISPHSHSLGGKDNSLSCLASTVKARNQHQTQGEKKKAHLSLVKWSSNIEKFHSRGKDSICIDRSTIHSAEVYTTHKIHHHRRCTSSRLISGYFLAWNDTTLPLSLEAPRINSGTLRMWNVNTGPMAIHT